MNTPATSNATPEANPTRHPIGYLTPLDLQTGGTLKASPEDFVVDEIPAYEPCGEGEHLFLLVEKRDVSADFLIQQLARALGCQRNDIGTAGLKDRRAITRQWVSVPARCEEQARVAAIDGVQFLKITRHRNKLRTGHLKGNRFEIRLRDVTADSASAAERIATELARRGVPNLYGDQRFGIEDETLTLGLRLLAGTQSVRSIPFAKRKFLLRLALSAAQSTLFNELLATRLEQGSIDRVLPGDVLQVVASGGCFLATDVAIEQLRVDSGETVITGPMFGPRMKQPEQTAAELEAAVLSRWNLEPAAFEKFPDLTTGTRRALMAQIDDLTWTIDGNNLSLRFALPSGAYATSVIREFQKTPPS